MRKGDKLERDFSISMHNKFHPVLISSLLLRSLNAGQIDVAGLIKKNGLWEISLIELKFSHFPNNIQWQRLKRAQEYLSKVLEIAVKLEVKFCQKDDP